MDSKKDSVCYEPYVYKKLDTATIKQICILSLLIFELGELSPSVGQSPLRQDKLEILLAYAETSVEARGSKKVPWDDDDPDYMYASEAIVKFTNGKMPVPTLSKLLTPEGPIRFMRKGRRCKVHIGEFIRYARQHYLSDAFAAVVSEEYIADIAARKLQERQKTNK